MVAVLAFIQSFGGADERAIASPTIWVVTILDSLIYRRLASSYRQLTLRPARWWPTPGPPTSWPTPPRCFRPREAVPLVAAGRVGQLRPPLGPESGNDERE